MTAINHALTGAVIALAVKQPALAIPLAFLSHFLTDLIPHFEARDMRQPWPMRIIVADVLMGAILSIMLPIILISDVSMWVIFFCMVAAMSPDYIWGWRLLRIKNLEKVFLEPMSRLSRFHKKIQWSQTLRGAAVEVVWLVACVIIIIDQTN